MLKKLILWYKLNKFYKIFGEELDCPSYRIHFKDMFDYNTIFGCGFDIAEAIDAQSYGLKEPDSMLRWLNKLYIALIH